MRSILFLATLGRVEFAILAGIVRFVDGDCVGSGEVFLELQIGGASGDACSNDSNLHFDGSWIMRDIIASDERRSEVLKCQTVCLVAMLTHRSDSLGETLYNCKRETS